MTEGRIEFTSWSCFYQPCTHQSEIIYVMVNQTEANALNLSI